MNMFSLQKEIFRIQKKRYRQADLFFYGLQGPLKSLHDERIKKNMEVR